MLLESLAVVTMIVSKPQIDRVEEAAAIARVQGLEARAEQLKNDMPTATEVSASNTTSGAATIDQNARWIDHSR